MKSKSPPGLPTRRAACLSPGVPAPRLTIVHTESSMGWGGQEIRVMAEMEGLRSRGHRMMLAAPASSRIFQVASDAGFESLPLSTARWALPANTSRLALWFRRHHVDVVNPHSSRDGWSAGLGARLAGVPFILRSRHFHVPIASRITSRFVYTALADHLVTTSPAVTDQFRRAFRLPTDRVSTIPTGIDPDRYHPKGPKARLDIPEDLPLIGMIAVLRWAKGHIHLVRAARILHDQGLPVRLVFVGDGPSRAPIDEEIARLDLGEFVHYTGHRPDVPEILRRLDCAAFPSRHESIPQTALQAMACGVPVVGSDVGGIPHVIRDGETGRIFPDADDTALADRIRDVLKDRPETLRLSGAARGFVEQEHSLNRMLDQVESLYHSHLPELRGCGNDLPQPR
jgi:glycosyltransferase involved in cell wall biosynthesis